MRDRLHELLEEAGQRPLTLISAPAGFGKTTLITNWIYEHGNPSRTAWLSLDEDDSDLVHFVYYLIATLQTVEPKVARAPISLRISVAFMAAKVNAAAPPLRSVSL